MYSVQCCFILGEFRVFWRHICFPHKMAVAQYQNKQIQKYLTFTPGDRCLHLLHVGMEVRGDSRIGPDYHNNPEEDGVFTRRGGRLLLWFLRGGPIHQDQGGETAFILAKPWLSAVTAGLLETLVRPPAWMTCNKPVRRWKREIPWLIKNTQMDNKSPPCCISINHCVFVCSLKS